MEPEPAGNHFWSNIYGNSENATIRARLRAEAMSKAVSSMIAVLFRFGRLSLTKIMQFGCHFSLVLNPPDHGDESEYLKRHRHEFGIIAG